MLTLRQIEVVRAIMVTGSVGGAAKLLNVSAPGVSRTMKYAESVLGMKLFAKKGGRYVPTREAGDIFTQINSVYDKVEDLNYVVGRMKQGERAELRIASVPSISNAMVPRAIADVRRRYPKLVIEIDVLKIEEALDYLLLGKGEAVAMSYKLDHPALSFQPLAEGTLKCIVPREHPLARRRSVAAREIAQHPLIGIDPRDPYGRIMARLFVDNALPYDLRMRARFGTTVCALVTNGLGIAIIDEFSLAGNNWPELRVLDIQEPRSFQAYVATRRDATLSGYCEVFVARLRQHMTKTSSKVGSSRKVAAEN